jgi:metal-responsive CopG/Arc/MetJ family transcriptional regulator
MTRQNAHVGQISVRIPDDVIRRLDAVAQQKRATRSKVIVDALRKQLALPPVNLFDSEKSTAA